MSGVWLSEPDAAAKRLARAQTLVAKTGAPPAGVDRLRHDLRSLRRAAVAGLPELAAQAHAAWTSSGLVVHAAASASEAAAIIGGIAGPTRQVAVNRSATVAKEVAPELRAIGLTVTETYNLYLEQASQSPRAFWQMPPLASHDVLGCFARPREIVAARRHALAGSNFRDVVGVIGVAAAAASDGSLFLLQHFHNAAEIFNVSRKVVLVVGLEKLVPSAQDALLQTRCTALFGAEATLLDLHPVAGAVTGVPLDAHAAAEGAAEVHVILLDNGRRALRNGDYRDLLACIGCRACAVRCPTYRYYSGPQRWSPRDYLVYHLQDRNPSLDLCVGCGMCLAQCPIAIDIPALMLRAKAGRTGGVAGRLLSNFEAVAQAASRAPGLSNRLLSSRTLRRATEPVLGLKAERQLPRFADQSFPSWLRGQPKRQASGKVAYFAGCTAQYVEPLIGKATVEVLGRAGLEVLYPDQVCCGVPQLSYGRLEVAREKARRNIRSLLAPGCDVVTACTSCALALKREYQHVLAVEGAEELAARTYDVMEYIARLAAERRLPAVDKPRRLSVLYHAPCHLKVRGDDLVQGRVDLLSRLPGVQAQLVERGCCGIAGTFGSRREGYALSMAIGSSLFDEVRRAAPDVIATDCPTCSLQLEQGTGMKPVHPIVLLWQAYGAEGGGSG